jgi:formylglycine-generating enzyme required for sulfatase activity
MRFEKKTAYLSLCVGLGFTAACSAVLGIKDFTAAKTGPDSGDDGGTTEEGGSDVNTPPGDGGDAEAMAPCTSGAPEKGCACTPDFQLGCNGPAQSEAIICSGGKWVLKSTCGAGMNCDSRDGGNQGMCAAIDPTCADAGAAPNQSICTNNSVVSCGPDLVSSTPPVYCEGGACFEGGCVGSCIPGTVQCAPHSVAQTCSATGGWDASSTNCLEGCAAGACTRFPSCTGGSPGPGTGTGFDCGPQGGDASTGGDCCASLEVPGGSFKRNYDGVTTGNTNPNFAAQVSGFRLDAYEVTVGRFRNFVTDIVANPGHLPAAGDGKHKYLNGGNGLSNSAPDGGAGNEAGWNTAWNSSIATTTAAWNTNLSCGASPTWTTFAGSNENLPISCVTWFEAYAFCIWDGGFLPSDAELNFAASGGSEQRVYPWSSPSNSTTIDCTHANYQGCVDGGPNQAMPVGSDSPLGDGRWGHSDLAGNVWEWSLDAYATQFAVGTDVANTNVSSSSSMLLRGGSYALLPSTLYASYRTPSTGTARDPSFGVRCGRAP